MALYREVLVGAIMSPEPTVRIDNTFAIAKAAKMVGLHPQLLRTWELRYGWPRAKRLPNGYRSYSPAMVEALRRVAGYLKSGHCISDLIIDGELHAPTSETKGPEANEIINDLRCQIAELRECLNSSPREYWTGEALDARERALNRCTGGSDLNAELFKLREDVERSRALALAGTRPAMQALKEAGVIEYLTKTGRYTEGDSLEVVIASHCRQYVSDYKRLTNERNEARNQVEDLHRRQGELVRRLDAALKANDTLLSREMPKWIKRAKKAERRVEQLTARER